jgi:hypothetical protein
MRQAPPTRVLPILALRGVVELAAALGYKEDFVREHGIHDEIPSVRRGNVRTWSVTAVQRWLDDNEHRVFEEPTYGRAQWSGGQ